MKPRPSLALLLLVTCVSGRTVSADNDADLVEDAEEARGQEAEHAQLHSADGDDPLLLPWVHRRYKRRIHGDYDTLPKEMRMRKVCQCYIFDLELQIFLYVLDTGEAWAGKKTSSKRRNEIRSAEKS